MLKKIISVSGKPGLFKLISQTKNLFVAESLIDHKRIPVYMRDKVTPLDDIAVFTEDDDIPLRKVLQLIREKQNETPLDFDPVAATPEALKTWFADILPQFDKKRVYPSDIKKIATWYNLLLHEGLTHFEEEEEEKEVEEKTPETPEQ
jgi:hypothetical protein